MVVKICTLRLSGKVEAAPLVYYVSVQGVTMLNEARESGEEDRTPGKDGENERK